MGLSPAPTSPLRRNEVPDWMDPEKAQSRRLLPSTLVLLQTLDGGATWKPSSASIFGKVTRISLTHGGDSLGLVEFSSNFEWPSEVYRFHAGGGESTRVYRKADRFITDILLTESGTAYLAGTEATAVVRDNPIANKVKIIRTRDNENFEEMQVGLSRPRTPRLSCRCANHGSRSRDLARYGHRHDIEARYR